MIMTLKDACKLNLSQSIFYDWVNLHGLKSFIVFSCSNEYSSYRMIVYVLGFYYLYYFE